MYLLCTVDSPSGRANGGFVSRVRIGELSGMPAVCVHRQQLLCKLLRAAQQQQQQSSMWRRTAVCLRMIPSAATHSIRFAASGDGSKTDA